jgi:hypothetical protein
MESDDSAVSRAAHLMVGTLAGSLAHVTSKVFLHKVHGCSFQLYIQSQHSICCITGAAFLAVKNRPQVRCS